jgi:hypothetical protein
MPVTRLLLALLLLFVLGAGLSAPFAQEKPAPPNTSDELYRWLPDDVGFTLSVRGLRSHWSEFQTSPLMEQWQNSPLGKRIFTSTEFKQLNAIEEFFKKEFGLGIADFRDEVFGDLVLFAYKPGPVDKPDQEQGLFLAQPRSPKKLALFLDKLDAFQKTTGELKNTESRERGGIKYICRNEAKATSFYLLHEGIFLFTGQEALLRSAIDQRTKAKASNPAMAVALKEMKLDTALIALTLNPRAWDSAILTKASDAPTKNFATCWKALQGIGLGVHVDRDVQIRFAARAKADDLPAALRRFFQSAGQGSVLMASLPEDALLVTGGRIDAEALHETLGLFMSKTTREGLEEELNRSLGAMMGKSITKDVIPALGPDWGFALTAPPKEGKQWAPNALFAVKVAPGDAADPVDEAILATIHAWAQMAVLGHNKNRDHKPMSLRSTIVEGIKIRSILGGENFPVGVEPSCAIKGGYLVLASSPAVIRGFSVAKEPKDAPLLRFSPRRVREWMQTHRNGIVEVIVQKEKLPRAKVLEQLAELRGNIGWLESVELQRQGSGDAMTLTLKLVPSVGLRK